MSKRSARKLALSEPFSSGSARASEAEAYRRRSAQYARLSSRARTQANGEETNRGAPFAASFTKGLDHDEYGLLKHPASYRAFVAAINAENPSLFDDLATPPQQLPPAPHDYDNGAWKEATPNWRGWESPRAGLTFDPQGPDAGAVAMAPAPVVGSDELAFEMGEVYALALLRDVPFSAIAKGEDGMIGGAGQAKLSAKQACACLEGMSYLNRRQGKRFARNRKAARLDPDGRLTLGTLFRGSTPGAKAGPYISQFLLVGSATRTGQEQVSDGHIEYGTLLIDQRTQTHLVGVDHMTDWCTWLNVQKGANVGSYNRYETGRRFLTTPRDLATYVHFDALYEAYLNAALLLNGLNAQTSRGFPEPSPMEKRTAFATFGGPHVLSLVTEVATRCLRAVRRQKFNYHRRCRPEAIGGRLTALAMMSDAKAQTHFGAAREPFEALRDELPDALLDALKAHNVHQNRGRPSVGCLPKHFSGSFDNVNCLLPMAFTEGSPMHPAYGAGHATVAGGCVTILKAFFEMFDAEGNELPLVDGAGGPIAYEPDLDAAVPGSALKSVPDTFLTIQGELDKLAANISIGRNMAGVHYYSDYYDSLRMGERVAVGMLLEQAAGYGETVEMTFTTFDGDHLTLSGSPGAFPSLAIIDVHGDPVEADDWWHRHTVGEEVAEDVTA